MGCINSQGNFSHWFGNIHLSGLCNRSCYFCIGQHMQALDPLDNLSEFPLKNIDAFIDRCIEKGVREINVTGTNTDPLLYAYTKELKSLLASRIPNLVFGIRTNGVLSEQKADVLKLYDKGSITICSFDPLIYRQMMGSGNPPDLDKILKYYSHFSDLKINVVLGKENVGKDLKKTIAKLSSIGIKKVNLREPYGQAHVGNPLSHIKESGTEYGMPFYMVGSTKVTYWDVHYVEVESVNLYANGVISDTYPITKGHDPVNGSVIPQNKWTAGRHFPQWNKQKQ